MLGLALFCVAAAGRGVQAASSLPGVGSPHRYSGQPKGSYDTDWQDYFQVTDGLPNVTFDLPRNWAGNIAVKRTGHPDDSLFFWGFEKEQGSLTAAAGENNDAPWGIWLNGGPGSSSMAGLFFENGPIRIEPDYSIAYNNWSWHNLMDYFWIDNPVGVGYSTAESDGFAKDEDQIGEDFMGFLENLVAVFPSLATRPLYLTGESYAGRFVSYITKTYFSMSNPPVNLAHILLGDPALGDNDAFKTLPTLSIIETYPHLIGYNTEVYDYFKAQSTLCNFTTELSYPGDGAMATVQVAEGQLQNPGRNIPDEDDTRTTTKKHSRAGMPTKSGWVEELREKKRHAPVDRVRNQKLVMRDLTGRPNGTIDPWYGCFLWDMLTDYAVNFTFPWTDAGSFDPYDAPDAMNPDTVMDASVFLGSKSTAIFGSIAKVRSAIHAPTNKDWSRSIDYPWGSSATGGDPSVEPMAFLDELASNMSAHGIPMTIYSGNDDAISPHFGTELTIQNTTFGGVQGFTRKPSTPWNDDLGNWAGIIHQERNWTYALFNGAGHQGPYFKPAAFYRFVRDFVLGDDQTGLVTSSDQEAVGGENSVLEQGIIPGQPGILYGTATAPQTFTYPTETVAAFLEHVGISSITFTTNIPVPTPSSSSTAGTKSAAVRLSGLSPSIVLFIFCIPSLLLTLL
ncbi:alpha/beta-hydrolase [Punctularia strigosozonata HHB-11173 SS5]|uniref:alpha/beta-hydrolase n=1 Tax=Punctularia strigosozonata (strain HHB-11173) TaxID=741275 RepID=UPI0004416472|nr:alpha/beta-hydrolase [Punctularia strigosozonata HHB-11173 SS5]EIN09574.1 alpha/beta-hydrolase [Punctularia strigosozonata HHB-11173 SS5]